MISQSALQIDLLSFCKGRNCDAEREGDLLKVLQQARGTVPAEAQTLPPGPAVCPPALWCSSVINGKQKSSSESINQLPP